MHSSRQAPASRRRKQRRVSDAFRADRTHEARAKERGEHARVRSSCKFYVAVQVAEKWKMNDVNFDPLRTAGFRCADALRYSKSCSADKNA